MDFTVYIVYTAIVCWHFHTLYWNKYLGATPRPRYNGGVPVILESSLYRTAL